MPSKKNVVSTTSNSAQNNHDNVSMCTDTLCAVRIERKQKSMLHTTEEFSSVCEQQLEELSQSAQYERFTHTSEQYDQTLYSSFVQKERAIDIEDYTVCDSETKYLREVAQTCKEAREQDADTDDAHDSAAHSSERLEHDAQCKTEASGDDTVTVVCRQDHMYSLQEKASVAVGSLWKLEALSRHLHKYGAEDGKMYDVMLNLYLETKATLQSVMRSSYKLSGQYNSVEELIIAHTLSPTEKDIVILKLNIMLTDIVHALFGIANIQIDFMNKIRKNNMHLIDDDNSILVQVNTQKIRSVPYAKPSDTLSPYIYRVQAQKIQDNFYMTISDEEKWLKIRVCSVYLDNAGNIRPMTQDTLQRDQYALKESKHVLLLLEDVRRQYQSLTQIIGPEDIDRFTSEITLDKVTIMRADAEIENVKQHFIVCMGDMAHMKKEQHAYAYERDAACMHMPGAQTHHTYTVSVNRDNISTRCSVFSPLICDERGKCLYNHIYDVTLGELVIQRCTESIICVLKQILSYQLIQHNKNVSIHQRRAKLSDTIYVFIDALIYRCAFGDASEAVVTNAVAYTFQACLNILCNADISYIRKLWNGLIMRDKPEVECGFIDTQTCKNILEKIQSMKVIIITDSKTSPTNSIVPLVPRPRKDVDTIMQIIQKHKEINKYAVAIRAQLNMLHKYAEVQLILHDDLHNFISIIQKAQGQLCEYHMLISMEQKIREQGQKFADHINSMCTQHLRDKLSSMIQNCIRTFVVTTRLDSYIKAKCHEDGEIFAVQTKPFVESIPQCIQSLQDVLNNNILVTVFNDVFVNLISLQEKLSYYECFAICSAAYEVLNNIRDKYTDMFTAVEQRKSLANKSLYKRT